MIIAKGRRPLALVFALVASIVLTSPSWAAEPGGTFVDDDGNVHEGMIEAVAAAGITRGCNPPANDRYCPGDVVTRGQMAAFLVRALGLPASSGSDIFRDDDGSVFEADIESLAEAGVTRGCDPPQNTRFCPDDPVSRGQMAAFLVRAYSYPPATADLFEDDDASVFEEDIERLAVAGVTLGCNPPDNDRFCPNDPVRRDQMASFLGRAEGLTPIVVPERCPVLPDDNIWNTRVDDLPLHPRSAAYVAAIGSSNLHPDFGSGRWEGAPIGIPYVEVDADQPDVTVVFTAYGDESDPGPYPVPSDAPIEGGPSSDGDRHVLVLDAEPIACSTRCIERSR